MKGIYFQIFCPDNGEYSIIIEDDERVCYAYLLKDRDIVGDVWLYNREKAPDTVEWKKEDMPFLNPLQYIDLEKALTPITSSDQVEPKWSMERDQLKEVQVLRYDEKIGGVGLKGYDLNGNILALQRRGKLGENTYGLMDNLKYTYQGNQLTKVDDAVALTSLENGFKELQKTTGEYTYDQNGNMLIDKNKGITAIEYNYLNLPRKVSRSETEYIIYTYDATGRKLSQQVFGTTAKVTDYLGEFIYENNALMFINHEEGRIIPGATDEYQYHLKDHLGNVRLTFTSKEEIETATATLEDANTSVEESQFLNYEEAITLNERLFDHTHRVAGNQNNTTFRSTRLLGASDPTAMYGLAKSLSVMPGDKITAKVYAKYVDSNDPEVAQGLRTFLALLGNGSTGGPLVDGGAPGSLGGGVFPFATYLNHENESDETPRAYLNYLIFDRDFNYLNGGFKRLRMNGRETGALLPEGTEHDVLAFGEGEIRITEPGFVYIYFSNENENRVEVFFDDFEVTHVKSPVALTMAAEGSGVGVVGNQFKKTYDIGKNLATGNYEQAVKGYGSHLTEGAIALAATTIPVKIQIA